VAGSSAPASRIGSRSALEQSTAARRLREAFVFMMVRRLTERVLIVFYKMGRCLEWPMHDAFSSLLPSRARGWYRCGMLSHELLRAILEEFGTKKAAAALDVSESLLYKWSEPRGKDRSGATNPLDRVADLLKATGDARIASWVCEKAGGYFVVNPKDSSVGRQLAPASSRVFHQFADMLSIVATSVEDNYVSKAEAKAIRAEWEELKSLVEGFVTSCEQGKLNPLAEKSSVSGPPK